MLWANTVGQFPRADTVEGSGVQGEEDGGLDAWENTTKENVPSEAYVKMLLG
jgi:hypothetical protein